MRFRIFDNFNDEYVEGDCNLLMYHSDLHLENGLESIAIQEDGSIIICDKCGNYNYLDPDRFELSIVIERNQ